MIPQNVKESLDRYAKDGIPTGGFLYFVLSNDLFEAAARADYNNLPRLADICSYIYNNLPLSCWGSPKNVKDWIEEKRHTNKGV